MAVARVPPCPLRAGRAAVSGFDIGLVIASGPGIGTLFTLYLVPPV